MLVRSVDAGVDVGHGRSTNSEVNWWEAVILFLVSLDVSNVIYNLEWDSSTWHRTRSVSLSREARGFIESIVIEMLASALNVTVDLGTGRTGHTVTFNLKVTEENLPILEKLSVGDEGVKTKYTAVFEKCLAIS